MKERSHARKADKTHINVSLSKEELAALDALAKIDCNSRSGAFRKLLKQVAFQRPAAAVETDGSPRASLLHLYDTDPEARGALTDLVTTLERPPAQPAAKAAEPRAMPYSIKKAAR